MKLDRNKKLPMCKPSQRVFIELPDGKRVELKGESLKAFHNIVDRGFDPSEALSIGIRLLSLLVSHDESGEIKWQ